MTDLSHVSVSNSSKHTFHDCKRKYFYEYIRRLTPLKEAHYFVWGSLVHKMSELTDKGYKIKETIDVLRGKVENQLSRVPNSAGLINHWEALFIMLEGAWGAYVLYYADRLGQYQVHSSETKFDIILPNGAHFKGKLDKIVQEVATGELFLWEIKTAAQTGEHWWDASLLDTQGPGYCYAARKAMNVHTSAVIYDVLKKPMIQQRSGEDELDFARRIRDTYLIDRAKYFERKKIIFSDEEIDNYEEELMRDAQLIDYHTREVLWDKQHPRNRIGKCAYFPLCTLGENGITLAGFYQRTYEDLFKELSEEE